MSILSDALKKADRQYRSKKKSTAESLHSVAINSASLSSKFRVTSYVLLLCVLILSILLTIWWFYHSPSDSATASKVKKQKSVVLPPTRFKAAQPKKNQPTMMKVEKPKPNNKIVRVKKKTRAQLVQDIYNQSITYINNSAWDRLNTYLGGFESDKDIYLQVVSKVSSSLLSQQNYQVVVGVVERALMRYPGQLGLNVQLAQALFKTGQYDKSLYTLNKNQPDIYKIPNYYALKALVYIKLKKYKKARRLYRLLVSKFPDNADYAMGYGISLQMLGKLKMALNSYQTALNVAQPGWNSYDFVESQILSIGE